MVRDWCAGVDHSCALQTLSRRPFTTKGEGGVGGRFKVILHQCTHRKPQANSKEACFILSLSLSLQLPGTANPLCQCRTQLLYREITQQQQQKFKNKLSPSQSEFSENVYVGLLFIWLLAKEESKTRSFRSTLVDDWSHNIKTTNDLCHIVFSLLLQLRLLPDDSNNSMAFSFLLLLVRSSLLLSF